MIELNNVFIHEDIYHQVFHNIPYQRYINLNKEELLVLLDSLVSQSPVKEIDGCTTHEAYVVLSYMDCVGIVKKLRDTDDIEFKRLYDAAIARLREHIYTNDEVLAMLDSGAVVTSSNGILKIKDAESIY